MNINLAQSVRERIETILETVNIGQAIEHIREISEKHVDVLVTYTLGEYIDSEKIICKVKASTSLYQRTLLLLDSYTLRETYLKIRNIVTRGGIVLLTLDYDDVRDFLSENQLIIESTGPEIASDIVRGVEISETVEDQVILRIPLYALNRIEDGNTVPPRKRTIGIFYRDWKIKYAWISGDLLERSQTDINIFRKIEHYISEGSNKHRLVVDYQIYTFMKDILPSYTLISPKIYTLSSLKNIVNKESDIVLSTSTKISKLTDKGEHINIATRCLEKYLSYIWSKRSEYIRPLLTLIYMLENIYRNIDIILVSRYVVPLLPSKGKYDIRLVTRIPSDILETVDIVLKDGIESLYILEEKLPQNIKVIYITDYEELLKNIEHLRKLKRSKIVIMLESDSNIVNIICHLLKILHQKYILLEISNSTVYEFRKVLDTDTPIIILIRDKKDIVLIGELCDKCGSCSRILCTSITIDEKGPRIDFISCNRCYACIIACTRGAIQPSQESHN